MKTQVNTVNLPTSKTLPRSSWVAYQLIAAELTSVVKQCQASEDQFKTRHGCTKAGAIADCTLVLTLILNDAVEVEPSTHFGGYDHKPAFELLEAWIEVRKPEVAAEQKRIKEAKREAAIRRQHHEMYGLGARLHMPNGSPAKL
jgi:hypothetical protein